MVNSGIWRKPRRAKVKSGCGTCKSRKLKCDEGRPACRRCVSSGRCCSGYGVWGGGGDNYLQNRQTVHCKNDTLIPWPPVRICTTEENRYFEWYRYRTAKKIPGAFSLAFWDILLLQASVGEPAVLHAILTMSSVHMRSIANGSVQGMLNEVPEEQEQFMLKHYVKSIDHLQPHFASKDKASVRIALISCIIFICIEYLRGHFKTAQIHLTNGLKILDETDSPSQSLVQSVQLCDPIGEWITRIFSRLHMQAELFSRTCQHSCKTIWIGTDSEKRIFCSINDAWEELERHFSNILGLTEQAYKYWASSSRENDCPPTLKQCQHRIQSGLSQWLEAYSRSQIKLQTQDTWEMARHLLSEYHAMATIMASASLSEVESIYDSHTHDFLSVLNHSTAMYKFSAIKNRGQTPLKLSRNMVDMSHSIVDTGWIPPLYYTALKCRIRSIRLHAIRLIESASHREGIWDSKIASRVAKKVVEIEENCEVAPEFEEGYELDIKHGGEQYDIPSILEMQRVSRVQVVLEDGPMDKVAVVYRKSRGCWKETMVNLTNE